MLPLTISESSRPRVLLADDHLQVLESVSSFLSTDFEVVATASDGREAVDLALRLQPDVAVLDMAMPGLDGFQTVEELKRHGSQAKPVFLTMHAGDEFIKAAIDAGVLGYVLKSRIYTDLFSAIGHALHGRLFAPSLPALSAASARGRHAVQFHNNDRFFLDELSQFVGGTLQSGEPVVLVTGETTRVGVAQRLQAGGFDLEALMARGQYSAQDSADGLAQMMRDDRLDRDALAAIIDGLERSRVSLVEEPQGRLTMVGDIANPLCRSGNFEAVIEIEQIWNELTSALPFFTLCLYPVECFHHESLQKQFAGLCTEHGAVGHTPSAG
jgi:DNA-binding NarL/FixJ family response regulator